VRRGRGRLRILGGKRSFDEDRVAAEKRNPDGFEKKERTPCVPGNWSNTHKRKRPLELSCKKKRNWGKEREPWNHNESLGFTIKRGCSNKKIQKALTENLQREGGVSADGGRCQRMQRRLGVVLADSEEGRAESAFLVKKCARKKKRLTRMEPRG